MVSSVSSPASRTFRGSSHRGSGARSLAGLNAGLVGLAVAIGVVGYLVGDRTNWTDGFGFDGRFYGNLAQHFFSSLFGHAGVLPPGIGAYSGPKLVGVDSYYALRVVPSGVVWAVDKALAIAPTRSHVVAVFSILDGVMYGVVVLSWCLSADLLRLSTRAKLVGVIALVVNFAVLRTGTYWPVLTDEFAYAEGALSLYLWLRGYTAALVLCTLVAAFTWPLQIPVGLLLILFPYPARALGRAPGQPDDARPQVKPAALAAALVGAILLIEKLTGYASPQGTPGVAWTFPLGLIVASGFVFVVFAYLLPRGGSRGAVSAIRKISPGRAIMAAVVLVVVFAGRAALSHRAGYNDLSLSEGGLWSSALYPGNFLVVFVCYFGPLLVVLALDWPRVGADARRFGPGFALVVIVGLLSALLTDPRKLIDVYPELVLLGVLAAERRFRLTSAELTGFAVLSLILARVWLRIGPLSTDASKINAFPDQRYFMSSGLYTTPLTYLLQLAAVIAMVALLAWRARTRPPAVASASVAATRSSAAYG